MIPNIYHPVVWGPDGRENFPRLGKTIPAGSILKDGGDFKTLPESHWDILKIEDEGSEWIIQPTKAPRGGKEI